MNDSINQPTQLGDLVAYEAPYSKKLSVGVIKKYTPKNAGVVPLGQSEDPEVKITLRAPHQFIRITEQHEWFKENHPENLI